GEAPWALVEELAGEGEEVACLPWQGGEPPRAAWEDLLEALDPGRAQSPEEAVAGLERARCLCALRQGPAGVEGLNALLAAALGRPRLHAHGSPVLVTRNAYGLGVHNGDMGVLWAEGERLRACFPREQGLLRLPLGELPAHEPAYALTVHKSQGSEYERVLLVLPPEPHPLVTRELLYTALTRARRQVRILASPASWEAGVARPTRRTSGLAWRLERAQG
ncbi:MAG: exodeoxyribonuclease V subunit alpha, partial [Gammaproteobacteria bacterium]